MDECTIHVVKVFSKLSRMMQTKLKDVDFHQKGREEREKDWG